MVQRDTMQLLRGWHAGDAAALEELIDRNLPWVQEQVHRRLGDKLRRIGDTQDFVQETMMQVLRDGPKFEIADDHHFRALLARIVENTMRMGNRFLGRQRRDPARERGAASDTILRLDPPQKGVTRPSEIVDRDERLAWIRLALELLEPEDREVIWLYEMDGQTFKQVGEVIGTSEEGARKRFQRAMPRLMRKVTQLQKGELDEVLG